MRSLIERSRMQPSVTQSGCKVMGSHLVMSPPPSWHVLMASWRTSMSQPLS